MATGAAKQLVFILVGTVLGCCKAEPYQVEPRFVGHAILRKVTAKLYSTCYAIDGPNLPSCRKKRQIDNFVLIDGNWDDDTTRRFLQVPMSSPRSGNSYMHVSPQANIEPSFGAQNWLQQSGRFFGGFELRRTPSTVSVTIGCSIPRVPIAPLCEFDVINYWNNIALQAFRIISPSPPMAARALAILHIAVYDAVNSIIHKYEPYLPSKYQSVADGDESPVAAAGKAAQVVLSSLFPSLSDRLRLNLETTLANVHDGESKSKGIRLGEAIASAIISLRASDGASTADSPPYSVAESPGIWRRTPRPDPSGELRGLAALLPNYGAVKPFAILDAAKFQPTPPPFQAMGNPDELEVKLIGSKNSKARTAAQTNIALFWEEGAGTSTPAGHLNLVAQVVSKSKKLRIYEKARLFALLNMALADTALVTWKTKYVYNEWRPISAIRMSADPDIKDAAWTPLLTTPPFPAYISGHSAFAGAFEKVMSNFFGTDQIIFTLASEDPNLADRTFSSFSEAAEEDAVSRLYGGVHFRTCNQDGLTTGRKIGDDVFKNNLKAL